MASLKDLRNRIASVKATQKITKAMQMVAAAKLRRAQEAAEEARRKLDAASARLLAVQSVFTDRRAYVNALTYEYETATSNSAKASKKMLSTVSTAADSTMRNEMTVRK